MSFMLIADMSSGNLCQNNKNIIKRMIESIAEVDDKRRLILKWQLFKQAGDNIPLDQDCFQYAYWYAHELGFQTTASVFDIESLKFLLGFDIPFVKIANRPDLYWLTGEVPRNISIVVSAKQYSRDPGSIWSICCVSEYPAKREQYLSKFTDSMLSYGISDHCTNFDLYYEFRPEIYEFHFSEKHDDSVLDAGLYARTPEQIKEFLEKI